MPLTSTLLMMIFAKAEKPIQYFLVKWENAEACKLKSKFGSVGAAENIVRSFL